MTSIRRLPNLVCSRLSLYFRYAGCTNRAILLLQILLCSFVSLSAQNESNIKIKVEAGLNWKPAEKDLGLLGQIYSLEFKLKTSKNSFIGLRAQINENHSNNENYKPAQFFTDNNFSVNQFEETPGAIISLVPTFDYYVGSSTSNFNPYFGVGVGVYRLTPSIKSLKKLNSSDVLETSINNQVGFLIRGGIDVWKLTLGLEYNYLSEANIETPNGLTIGTVDDSFLALSIGYLFSFSRP